MKKEDALVRLELHLTSKHCFQLMDQIKNIKRYSDRIAQLLNDGCTAKRQESIRACQKWMDIEERNIWCGSLGKHCPSLAEARSRGRRCYLGIRASQRQERY